MDWVSFSSWAFTGLLAWRVGTLRLFRGIYGVRFMQFGQIGLLVLEASLVASLLLLLFHRRKDWGLTPLFVAMGVFQHMQVVLAGGVYVEVAPGVAVSPGSVVLFTSTLFAVLLVYIHEDALEARKLIYALVIANIGLAILSYTVSMHSNAADPEQQPHQFLRIMLVGTVCLFLDTVLLIVIYEAVGFRSFGSFLRIFLTVTSVLCIDQVLFATGAFFDAADYGEKLFAGLIGKVISGLFYASVLWAYVRWRGTAPSERGPGYSWDVFQLLSYRQKFDILGAEYDVLDERVQQRTQELREANARLTELSRRLLNAHETERRNLARELHDEVGQLLTVIKMQMQSAKNLSEGAPAESLGQAIGTVNETIEQIRSLSLRLRPSILDDLGLNAAIEWQAEQLTEHTGIDVKVNGNFGEDRFSTEVETVFFRCAQEAITNVMRHSQATSVSIELSRSETDATMCIRDDGRGFDPKAVMTTRKRGMGLVAMQERVGLVGGVLRFNSTQGSGTQLQLCCPIVERECESDE